VAACALLPVLASVCVYVRKGCGHQRMLACASECVCVCVCVGCGPLLLPPRPAPTKGRLKELSLATGAELDSHNALLDTISSDLDRTNSSLHKATARAAKLSKS
jgi:hypothetical protein